MNRILILRLSSLGDVVLTTSVIKTLQDSLGTELYFVTKKIYAPILRGLLEDNRLLLFSEQTDALPIRQQIKHIKPDVILDLHNNARTHIMTSGLSKVYRVPKHRLRRMIATKSKNPKEPHTVLNDYREILARNLSTPELSMPYLADRGIPGEKGRILIHPGAKWELKKWPLNSFITLYNLLKDRGFNPIFVSDGQWDHSDYRFVHTRSLDELMDEISSSSLFIGNDSGPSHIAAGLGVPSITIFGPTHPCLGFTPQGSEADYITLEYNCSPCTLHGKGKCRQSNTAIAKCLSDISPEAVLEMALRKLQT